MNFMNDRTLTSATVALLCALAGALALASPPAMALNTHIFSFSFASSGSGAGQLALTHNSGVALDSATHEVYVADTFNSRVDQFSSSGSFVRAWGWGVADGLPMFETCTLTCQAGVPGSGAGQFTSPTFIAVDNSGGASAGDVYVGDSGDGLVQKFSSSGVLVSTWGDHSPSPNGQLSGSSASGPIAGPFGPLAGVAVDTGGKLYVLDTNSNMFEFAQDGSFATDFNVARETGESGLAVDTAGNFFKGNRDGSVEKLTGANSDVGQVNESEAQANGVAVDTANNDLYVALNGGLVEHYAFDGSGNVVEPGIAPCPVAPNSGCAPTDSFGSGHINKGAGVAVDPTSHAVYVTDNTSLIDVFIPAVVPDVSTNAASSVVPTGATLNGSVNPDGIQLTDCRFEYGTSTAYGQSVPCVPAASAIPADSSPHAVSASLTGLQPGTTYHFRLNAANADGAGAGSDRAFTAPGPVIDATSVERVGVTTATLLAHINPVGLDASYHFEYGTRTSYGTSVPLPDADIGSSSTDQAVSQDIGGLRENTVYHYRVVATNSFGSLQGPDRTFMTQINPATCPNAALRTGPSVHLPDCRAYELVTPADKKTASQDLGFAGSEKAISSLDGERLFLIAGQATLGPNPMPSGSVSAFTRTASGWGITSLNPMGSGGDVYTQMPLLSPELTQAAVEIEPSGASHEGNRSFSSGPFGGPYSLLATVPFSLEKGAQFAGGSSDLSSVILESKYHNLLPGGFPTGTDAGAHDLYQWTNGHLSLVNVTTGGSLVSPCGAYIPWSSHDGSKIFFTSPDENAPSSESGCSQPKQLYMRIDGRETVQLSAPEAGVVDPNGPQPVQSVGASADLSKVFFMTRAELTADDGHRHDLQIYEYDTADRKLTRITAGVGNLGDGEDRYVTVSEDGSTVYFRVAKNGSTESYYRYDTATHTTSFVATALPSSRFEFLTQGAAIPDLEEKQQATPDGRFFIFESAGVAGIPRNPVGAQEDEIYRYDAADSSIVCVSCPSNEGPAHGGAYFQVARYRSVNRTPRYVVITDDGSYIFFQSNDHLVPQDVNQIGGPGAFEAESGSDVYEWHNGTVSLITPGNDAHGSVFLGASPDGSNVFFGTHAQLVPQDTDTLGDVYDARIGGGFPVASEPVPCLGDACHNPAAVPNDATPSSSTFSGPGNPTPALTTLKPKVKPRAKRCARGKARGKGKCAKKRKAKGARRAARHGRGRSR
jgi:hypothetical protein